MITLSTYCLCGGELVVSSYSVKTAMDIERIFKEAHAGDEHQLFASKAEAGRALRLMMAECRCVVSCADDPATMCSLSGESHVHPDDGSDTFGRCPVHPDAPGDL